MKGLLAIAAVLLLTGTAMAQSGSYSGFDGNGNYYSGSWRSNSYGGGNYSGFDGNGNYHSGNWRSNYYSRPTYDYGYQPYRFNYRSTNSLYGW